VRARATAMKYVKIRTTLITVIAASRGPLTLSEDVDSPDCSVVIIMALYLVSVSDGLYGELV
jgi:hypothetical protein